jgi:hypothetical protein
VFFVIDADVHFDGGGVEVDFLRKIFGEFALAEAEEADFERRDAVETPDGIDDGLDQAGFFGAGGLVIAFDTRA